jgi:hypothetical protein
VDVGAHNDGQCQILSSSVHQRLPITTGGQWRPTVDFLVASILLNHRESVGRVSDKVCRIPTGLRYWDGLKISTRTRTRPTLGSKPAGGPDTRAEPYLETPSVDLTSVASEVLFEPYCSLVGKIAFAEFRNFPNTRKTRQQRTSSFELYEICVGFLADEHHMLAALARTSQATSDLALHTL